MIFLLRWLLRATLVAVLNLGNVTACQAAWYQVEVVVFSYTNPDSHGELWYENPGVPDMGNTIELITDAVDPLASPGPTVPDTASAAGQPLRIPYRALPPSRYRLDGVERVLKLSREYHPILHVAWQQPGEGARDARAVHLELPRSVEDQAGDDPAGPGPGGMTTGVEDVVDGIIRLRVSRFLHVDVDMAYFPEDTSVLATPATGTTPAADQVPAVEQHADYVRLTESRKIKLNELDYFDHPLFGVLLQVSRLRADQLPSH